VHRSTSAPENWTSFAVLFQYVTAVFLRRIDIDRPASGIWVVQLRLQRSADPAPVAFGPNSILPGQIDGAKTACRTVNPRRFRPFALPQIKPKHAPLEPFTQIRNHPVSSRYGSPSFYWPQRDMKIMQGQWGAGRVITNLGEWL